MNDFDFNILLEERFVGKELFEEAIRSHSSAKHTNSSNN